MDREPGAPMTGALRQVFRWLDLSSLSVSSVAPIFSVAAAGSLMARTAGPAVIWAVALVAVPFLVCAWLFLTLNRHFPHAGASYHWARRIVGPAYSHVQAWIIVLAYFWSIPPILLPAAQFTGQALGLGPLGKPATLGLVLAWTLIAAAVLLSGASLTARVTQVFLAVELVSVAVMGIVGFGAWGQFGANAAWLPVSRIHGTGVIVAMVVAATIVDGWEIDSYAAEESRRPRTTPGWGGLAGALAVVLYYLTIWPILLHEVPLAALKRGPDVLLTWSAMVAPDWVPVFRIAVLASTASSLWLTAYILSRALYAMSRDGTMPAWLGGLNRRAVPVYSAVLPLSAALAVIVGSLLFRPVDRLFAMALGAAGFFLVTEFFMDGLNMFLFLVRRRDLVRRAIPWRLRMLLLLGSLFVVVSLGGLNSLFFVYAPRYLGSGVDWAAGILGAAGVGYVWGLRRAKPVPRTVIRFPDEEAADAEHYQSAPRS